MTSSALRIKPVVVGGVDGEVVFGYSEFVSWLAESGTNPNGVCALEAKELLEVGGDCFPPARLNLYPLMYIIVESINILVGIDYDT